MAFPVDLRAFLRARRRFRPAPIIIVTLPLGLLLMSAQRRATAPFIHTLF